MASSRSSTWKICVTCEHWTGPRQIGTFRTDVKYNSDQDKGECVGGGWNRMQKTASSSCNKYVKWSLLK